LNRQGTRSPKFTPSARQRRRLRVFETSSGTATIAPSNDAGSDASTVYVAMAGNGMGVSDDGTAQLWTFSYNLSLYPATLVGKVYGAEFESDDVENGEPFTINGARGVVMDVAPMACADY
jgi:hypothetical protein